MIFLFGTPSYLIDLFDLDKVALFFFNFNRRSAIETTNFIRLIFKNKLAKITSKNFQVN